MNENRNNSGTAGGIGFCGLLTIAFIILKLTGVISWSWLWVLAPIWIPAAIVLAVLLVVLIVVLVKEGVKQTEEKQRRQERSLGIDEQARHYGLERQPGESDLELKKRIAFLKQAREMKIPIEDLITHSFPLDKLNEAMEVNVSQKGIKIAYVAEA